MKGASVFPKLLRTTTEEFTPSIIVESKSYVVVRIAKEAAKTNVYWQLQDPIFSLLELGFEWPSGRLVHCSIPLFNGLVEKVESRAGLPMEKGTPYFEMSDWPVKPNGGQGISGGVLQEPGRIRILSAPSMLSIIAKEGFTRRSILYGAQIVCDFNELEELIALRFIGGYSV